MPLTLAIVKGTDGGTTGLREGRLVARRMPDAYFVGVTHMQWTFAYLMNMFWASTKAVAGGWEAESWAEQVEQERERRPSPPDSKATREGKGIRFWDPAGSWRRKLQSLPLAST